MLRFIVDSADPGTFEAARSELHALLSKPELRGIPLLVRLASVQLRWARRTALMSPTQVLANKNDIEGHTKVETVIEDLHLAKILDREVSCYSISGASCPSGWSASTSRLTLCFRFAAKSSRNIDLTLGW